MEASVLAHWLGGFGELFNLLGAAIIAIDLVARDREHVFKENVESFASFVKRQRLIGTKYRESNPAEHQFTESVLHKRSKMLGYSGLSLLFLGFLLLIAYHGIEIAYDKPTPECPKPASLIDFYLRMSEDQNVGYSEMPKSVLTKIAGKFQVTVPLEVRSSFGLKEGDLLEWTLEDKTAAISIVPKRAQLITPLVRETAERIKKKHEQGRVAETSKEATITNARSRA